MKKGQKSKRSGKSDTYNRGIPFIQVPTTLLAMVDSSVGGKTSINYNTYKNQLGNFYPPSTIIICNEFLDTLLDSDIKSGLGEITPRVIVVIPLVYQKEVVAIIELGSTKEITNIKKGSE